MHAFEVLKKVHFTVTEPELGACIEDSLISFTINSTIAIVNDGYRIKLIIVVNSLGA